MKIVGIDPGTDKMGLCVYDTESEEIILSTRINAKSWREDGKLNFLEKASIFIGDLTLAYEIDALWIERTFSRNSLAACLLVTMTDIMYETAKHGIEKTELIEVKKWRKLMCNKGNISKEECIGYVNKKFGKIFQSDEAEAIGIAIAAKNYYNEKRTLTENSTNISRKPKRQSRRNKLPTLTPN